MGALKEECRMGSSYLMLKLESWPGVELGRTIPDGEMAQLSASGNDERLWVRDVYSPERGELKLEGENVVEEGVVPLVSGGAAENGDCSP
jgi:hypothetical protein